MSGVLILGNSSGGLYDFRNGLLTELLTRGCEVTVSLPDEVRRRELEQEGCRFVLTAIHRRGMNPFEDAKLLLQYGRLLKTLRPDVVLCYTIKPNIYGGLQCRWHHVPYISTITGLGSTFQHNGLTKRLVTLLYRLGLRKSHCVFFQNAVNRQIFMDSGILRRQGTRLVSGSGVDLVRHRQETYPGHRDAVVRFLYVGRMMREKGTDEYLSAAKRLHERFGSAVSVAAIGYCDEDYEEKLAQAAEQGYLRMIPFDPEIHSYLTEADVIVMPSYHEGMSNVLMEGAAVGRPVLASDIPGCREIVEDQVTGLLFPPKSADALYAAMCRMMELTVEQRAEMGVQGRAKMEREFDRRQVTAAYMEEIGRIVPSLASSSASSI